jgi:small GTP-binding protein
MADEYDYLFKCIVVGDGGVGKTALTIRFSKGFFTEDYKMTIGVDFHVKTISIDTEEEGPIKVKLQIWDTGGQERFSSIRPMYYRGSLGGLLIFDLTSYESFEHLPQWIEEVRANIKSEIPLLLVGNKSDLINERAVSPEEITNFTEKFNLYYMETSAKTGEGVGDCFYILACLMVGSTVPEELVNQGIVYNPGQTVAVTSNKTIEANKVAEPVMEVETPKIQAEPEEEFIAPPIPEPIETIQPEPEIQFTAPSVPEKESEIQFTAPSVPEKEPEIQFTAPSVPEKEPEIQFTAPPVPEKEPETEKEPEIQFTAPPVPEKSSTKEIESFTPLKKETSESTKEPEIPFTTAPKISESKGTPPYKPKAIPFTSSAPIPAAPPEEFQSEANESNSLVDYMPEAALSKKERKRIEKQKKKEEKEKRLREKREKAAKLKAQMQNVGKDKKIKDKEDLPPPTMPQPSTFQSATKQKSTEKSTIPFQAESKKEEDIERSTLFQTLTQKSDKTTQASSSSFIPFGTGDTSEKEDSSELRIIPNIADLEPQKTQPSSILSQPQTEVKSSIPNFQRETKTSETKDIIICPYCGAMLSSEYAFCNKCGAKL